MAWVVLLLAFLFFFFFFFFASFDGWVREACLDCFVLFFLLLLTNVLVADMCILIFLTSYLVSVQVSFCFGFLFLSFAFVFIVCFFFVLFGWFFFLLFCLYFIYLWLCLCIYSLKLLTFFIPYNYFYGRRKLSFFSHVNQKTVILSSGHN